MNIPSFNAEASIYAMSTPYRLASGPLSQSDIQVSLSQPGGAPILRTPITSQPGPKLVQVRTQAPVESV